MKKYKIGDKVRLKGDIPYINDTMGIKLNTIVEMRGNVYQIDDRREYSPDYVYSVFLPEKGYSLWVFSSWIDDGFIMDETFY